MDGNNSGELIKCDFVIVNTGTQQNCEFTRNAGNTYGTGINVIGIVVHEKWVFNVFGTFIGYHSKSCNN